MASVANILIRAFLAYPLRLREMTLATKCADPGVDVARGPARKQKAGKRNVVLSYEHVARLWACLAARMMVPAAAVTVAKATSARLVESSADLIRPSVSQRRVGATII